MKISVVVPLFNRWNLTRECIRALTRTCPERIMVPTINPPRLVHFNEGLAGLDPGPMIATEVVEFEFLLIDNGSTDGTLDELRKVRFDEHRIRVGRFAENQGFAIGSNEGLAHARGDVVIFLNNDTVPIGNWWLPLYRRLQDPTIGAVGALLWYPGRARTVQHAGMAWTSSRTALKVMHLYRHRQASHEPGIRRAKPLQQVTGACLAMRTADARRLGGFCRDYLNGYEDVDLCFRIRFELGLTVWYEPAAELVHHESQTAGRLSSEMANEELFHARWRDKIEVDAVRVMNEDRAMGVTSQRA